MTFQKW